MSGHYPAGVNPQIPPVDPSFPPRVAAGVCLIEALLLVITAGSYGLELASGEAVEANAASMSLVVSLIFALLLLAIGMSWLRGRAWPRTPTIVWNLLLLPAAWTLGTTSGLWFGLGLAVLALAGVLGAVLAPAHELTDKAL